MSAKRNCGNCTFFVRTKDEATHNPFGAGHEVKNFGECTRYPPVPMELHQHSMPPVVSSFPFISIDRVCGEWRSAAGHGMATNEADNTPSFQELIREEGSGGESG